MARSRCSSNQGHSYTAAALTCAQVPAVVFFIFNVVGLTVEAGLVQARLANRARVREAIAEFPRAHEVDSQHIILLLYLTRRLVDQ
eukprot:COSAG01_NODE_9296_length_2491_cov_9.354933_3_plen_86_part_00